MSRFIARHKRQKAGPPKGIARWLDFLRLAALFILLTFFVKCQGNITTPSQTAAEITTSPKRNKSENIKLIQLGRERLFICSMSNNSMPKVLTHGIPKLSQKAACITGIVVVKVLVDLKGNVEEIEVLRSIPVLEEIAIMAAKEYKFSPALLDGSPIESWVSIPFNFKLK